MICLSPGTSEKTAKQIYRIDFQPGLTRNHHPDHPPNQNVVPSERSPVRWLKALLQQQSPNCCSVQLEPKVAILNCCDFRLHHWNVWKSCHDFRKPKVSHRGCPSDTFIFKRNMHPVSASLATHHSVLPSGVNGWKAAGLSSAKRRCIAWYRTVSLVTFQAFS